MNFGKWIVVAFIAFAGFIGTLVTICVTQDMPLVSKDYYSEELRYQDQITRMDNANSLQDKPDILVEDQTVAIRYSGLSSMENGKLVIFRPSDQRLDQQFEVKGVNDYVEKFELRNPVPGMYRAKLSWEQGGKQYFIEKVIVL